MATKNVSTDKPAITNSPRARVVRYSFKPATDKRTMPRLKTSGYQKSVFLCLAKITNRATNIENRDRPATASAPRKTAYTTNTDQTQVRGRRQTKQVVYRHTQQHAKINAFSQALLHLRVKKRCSLRIETGSRIELGTRSCKECRIHQPAKAPKTLTSKWVVRNKADGRPVHKF